MGTLYHPLCWNSCLLYFQSFFSLSESLSFREIKHPLAGCNAFWPNFCFYLPLALRHPEVKRNVSQQQQPNLNKVTEGSKPKVTCAKNAVYSHSFATCKNALWSNRFQRHNIKKQVLKAKTARLRWGNWWKHSLYLFRRSTSTLKQSVFNMANCLSLKC